MKSLLLLVTLFIFGMGIARAQKVFVCRDAHISFFSTAPLEDISAQTDSAVSSINLQTGAVYFKVAISSFQFEKGLMQKHFNEHYLESDRYPFAEFKGKILNFTPLDSEGIDPVTVEGSLTIHGVTKVYKTAGTLELKAGELGATSIFKIRLADHQIKIPKLLFQNIAEVVEVKVYAVYDLQ
ncbi:MAG TPA: YceI family protein [Chitinophagaceae bacterium]|nr:YceI family protein [Chitinophagaceae bacterium]